MRAVIAHRSGAPRVVDFPDPALGPGMCLVRVSHSALTLPHELEVLGSVARRLPRGQDGIQLGSSVSGIIEECGAGVRRLKGGLRVAAFGPPYVFHADRLVVPQNLIVELPKKVSHEEGAFAGQGAVALHLFRQSGCALGECVLVFGAGLVGILAAQVARAAGVNSLLVDRSEQRLAKARNVGVTDAVTEDGAKLIKEVDGITGGMGADAALITGDAGPDAAAMALELLRPGGRLVLGTKAKLKLDAGLVMEKELSVRSAQSAGPGRLDARFERDGVDYPAAMVRWTERDHLDLFCQLLASRRVQLSPLLTDRAPLDRAPLLFEKIARAPEGVLAAVLTV